MTWCHSVWFHIDACQVSGVRHGITWMSIKYDRVWHAIQSTPVSSIKYHVSCITKHGIIWMNVKYGVSSMVEYCLVSSMEYGVSIMVQYHRIWCPIDDCRESRIEYDRVLSNVEYHPVSSTESHIVASSIEYCQILSSIRY